MLEKLGALESSRACQPHGGVLGLVPVFLELWRQVGVQYTALPSCGAVRLVCCISLTRLVVSRSPPPKLLRLWRMWMLRQMRLNVRGNMPRSTRWPIETSAEWWMIL